MKRRVLAISCSENGSPAGSNPHRPLSSSARCRWTDHWGSQRQNAAVSVGLSVDSSIHYILAFRRARNAGHHPTQAIAEVQQSVGRAVVFSTLALTVGFLVLCSSEFVPTIYFGALAALSMLGGLLGNLLVLPLLLHIFSVSRVAGPPDGTDV